MKQTKDATKDSSAAAPRVAKEGRWYQVRPTLARLLAVGLLALVALAAAGNTPHANALSNAVTAAATMAAPHAQTTLNVLAAIAVLAVARQASRKGHGRAKRMVAAGGAA